MFWRRLVATVGLTMVALGAAATPALAVEDPYLILSSPQRHAQTDLMPGWVTLVFKTNSSAKVAKVLVLDSDGKNVTQGGLIVEGTNVTSQLEFDLPKGTYTVMYRTVGSDGAPRGGAYQFAYGKGNWTTLENEVWVGEAEQPPVMANPDPNATTPATDEPTASASATPTATESASATGTASAEPTGVATGTAGPQPGAEGAGNGLWLGLGAVVLVAAAGTGGWLWWRSRRSAE
ncbi:MAG: copper resistance protein CopC [Propionicimonas sp.]|uniref:copper resistance CopC family protein n=1 Tax=Propionicimonas sp. TaxID=1955623 RepID=UPI003D096A3F